MKNPQTTINITEEVNKTTIWKTVNDEKASSGCGKNTKGSINPTLTLTIPQKRKNKSHQYV